MNISVSLATNILNKMKEIIHQRFRRDRGTGR